MRKPKVLIVNEAHFISSGYSVIGKELLNRLYKTGKYDIAEYGIWALYNDIRAKNCPWTFYGNIPLEEYKEEREAYTKDYRFAFGNMHLDYVINDFRPDVVCSIRDPWMDLAILQSPLREYFKYYHMPTIDSAPLQDNWIADYMTVDGLFCYSNWGEKAVKNQAGGLINVLGWNPPSANSDIFKPINRKELRNKLSISDDMIVIGTVMRNQKRKLFPDLMQSFKRTLEKLYENGREDVCKKTYLYLHTAYPDLGWDLPKLLLEYGIYNRVLFTYQCQLCGMVFPSLFQGVTTSCKKCKKRSAETARTDRGIPQQVLNMIYNIMDLYIQYANCGGFEFGPVEAGMAGTPSWVIDYSSMEDYKDTLKSKPLKPQQMYLDLEQGAYRSIPNNDLLVDELYRILQQPQVLKGQREKVRKLSVKNYDWDKFVRKWMLCFDNLPLEKIEKKWKRPAQIFNPNLKATDQSEIALNSDFVEWCFKNILGESPTKRRYLYMKLLRNLNYGLEAVNKGGFFGNEQSLCGQKEIRLFTRDRVAQELARLRQDLNNWEHIRAGNIVVSNNCIKHKKAGK